MEELKRLEKKKLEIEEEMKELQNVLIRENVTMHTPLVTEDGFPRSDIDIPTIRPTRHKIITLRNDYNKIEDEIKKALENVLSAQTTKNDVSSSVAKAQWKESGAQDQGVDTDASFVSGKQAKVLQRASILGRPKPFCVVDSVAVGSPAQEAGLCVGDEIIRIQTCTSLSSLPALVQANLGKSLSVLLIRGYDADDSPRIYRLSLQPHTWQGPGVLGCHLR
ncbi:26S proteasome regulator [Schizosaccharomyces cryophilus OY26]|uniref:Probable 26S proteasome regulatory subunit p27 n=1 Tax=Schizosaccharomyces cryophilus (strain OY26 / ATCC MYA-4695 / CBS 11777 / NBRC 106824 / NRRL Y48691) TaxID=653667 RepID=S9VVI5_SCHCR|nr:26S proteasome regulator [Schizosaccharomyces cryophilus OY26]EPY50179.1 26S proteasome regulator [Schizosaccharomyces cryophilus OY26]